MPTEANRRLLLTGAIGAICTLARLDLICEPRKQRHASRVAEMITSAQSSSAVEPRVRSPFQPVCAVKTKSRAPT